MKLYIKADAYNELIEKGYGKRDYSKLTKKVVTDKNGHTRTVWVRNGVKQMPMKNKTQSQPFNHEEINKKLDDFVNSLQIKDFWVQDSQFSWPPVTKEEKFEKYLGNIKESVNRLKTYTPKMNENLGAILKEFETIANKNELRADKANEFITNIQHPIVKEFLKKFKKGQTVKISIVGFRDIPEWKIEDINGGAVTLRGITDKEGEEIVNMKYRSPFDDGTGWKEGKALKVYPKGGPKITSTGISFLEGFKTGRI